MDDTAEDMNQELMLDGNAAAGTSQTWARSSHSPRHPASYCAVPPAKT